LTEHLKTHVADRGTESRVFVGMLALSTMRFSPPPLETRIVENFPCAGVSPVDESKAPTAATYWRTLRHLRWSQLGHLALRRVLPRSQSLAEVHGLVRLRQVPGPWPFMQWQPEASRQMLNTREFTFLNRTAASNGAIPWNDQRHPKLWLYHLNYFDFLNVDFGFPDEEQALMSALAIALDWCAQNTQGNEAGWEPYPLSLRIINWLKFLARHQRTLESLGHKAEVNTLLTSLGVQVATLEHRLEKDLMANHLLKNIKALLFAGAWLETSASARWWSKGEALLEQQLHEQILADGGHFERSPMYHAQILEDLVELRLLCQSVGLRLAGHELLEQKIPSMAEFLRGILHPDGEIPLFNDSVLGGARAPAELLTVAGSHDNTIIESDSPGRLFAETGYGAIRNIETQSAVVFDCGPMGPDYQPGHGHCDVLSYELSLCGQRVVVDSGVSTYEPGPERSFERSTAAHNTIRIGDEEQAEVWASFRVGRRPRVGKLQGGNHGPFHFLSGSHDAYRRLGVIHARTILFHPRDTWLVVDLLRGKGSHLVESFLHFHPCVRIEALNDHLEIHSGLPLRRWRLEFADRSYLLTAYGAGEFDIRKSWYAERFGERQPSAALRWAWRGQVPTGMIQIFTPMGTPLPHIAPDWAGNSIAIDGHKLPLG
jgi:uncharacterized heparinase superfamily protein